VLEDQLALGRPLEALDSGLAPLLAQDGHEALGGDDPSPRTFQDARLHQGGNPGAEVRGDGLLAVGEVQHQQVVAVEAPDLLLPDGLQEAQEARVLDLPYRQRSKSSAGSRGKLCGCSTPCDRSKPSIRRCWKPRTTDSPWVGGRTGGFLLTPVTTERLVKALDRVRQRMGRHPRKIVCIHE